MTQISIETPRDEQGLEVVLSTVRELGLGSRMTPQGLEIRKPGGLEDNEEAIAIRARLEELGLRVKEIAA
jgi:hypothetical protein